MTMNRVKNGGGWEFLVWPNTPGFTWNPASGCKKEGCAVGQKGACYAEKIVKRITTCPKCPSFEPHMHDGSDGTPDKMREPFERKSKGNIAPVSTGDLFGLKKEQTKRILDIIKEAKYHRFFTLTKLPQNAQRYTFPKNTWFGVSVNNQNDVWRLNELKEIEARKKWAIFEPLYSKIDYNLSFLDWVIIGAQTNPERQPALGWVQSIKLTYEGPLFMKSNLDWIPRSREYPLENPKEGS